MNLGVVMTEQDKKLLSNFETQLRHLIYIHGDVLRENAELKQIISDKNAELQQLKKDYDSLDESYKHLKNAATISLKGSDVNETKKRLSELVREVDKCIDLLNKQ